MNLHMQNHNKMFVIRLGPSHVFAKLDYLLHTNTITSLYKPLFFVKSNHYAAGDYAVVAVSPYTLEQIRHRPGVFDVFLLEDDFVGIEIFQTEPKYSEDDVEGMVMQQVTNDNFEHSVALYDYYGKALKIKYAKELSWEELAKGLAQE